MIRTDRQFQSDRVGDPNRVGFFGRVAVLLMLLGVPSCASQSPPATLETLEGILMINMPQGAKLIGGQGLTESPEKSSLWLIVSPEPLPLPVIGQGKKGSRARRNERPVGTEFPVTALTNLVAACEVPVEDAPTFAEERGSTYVGRVELWNFSYREARIQRGWLTAVDINLTSATEDQAPRR